MRSIFTGASALILLVASVQAKHGVHEHLEAIHRRHRQERELARHANDTLVKRGTCAFPTDAGLVAVTPGSGNGGWAFAPDQTCYAGRYCPYACPAGQVSMQWDPSVTSYVYPGSMNGGLLCNSDGTVSKPFPNRPYCQSTTANIGVQNNCGQNVAFCQTVLPGDEDMLIPTDVTSWSKLAVPDTTYWAGTAAHYYINPPGVSSSEGCVWGSNANPYGNWAPYVAGANVDASGDIFIKLGWNPIYLETTTPFRNTMPTWGVKIECPNGGCNGLPCAIDPSQNEVNEMLGSASDGAGGGAFCVVTVAEGSSANFVVFEAGSASSSAAPSASSGAASSAATSVATSTAPSATGWSNLNQGGQFYQSNVLSSTTTTSSIQSTAASNTSTTSMTSTSSTTTETFSETTSVSEGPTGQPYYELFNTTAPAEPTVSSTSPVSTTSSLIAKHTGAASSMRASVAVILLGLGATLL